MAVEVIGAGFGRTGTLSLKTALDKLGYKTHHMLEVFKGGDQQNAAWLDAARRKAAGEAIDWHATLGQGGYTAAVDWPSVAFWKELLAANPSAKVILTLRDFDKWYDSVLETIYPINHDPACTLRPPPFLAPLLRKALRHQTMVAAVIWDGTFKGRFLDREYARQVYESHVSEVQRVVPAGQLLLFRPADGWGPLCAFLGRPAPEGESFPHVNDAQEFQERIMPHAKRVVATYTRVFAACNAAVLLAAAAGVAAAVQLLRGRAGRSG